MADQRKFLVVFSVEEVYEAVDYSLKINDSRGTYSGTVLIRSPKESIHSTGFLIVNSTLFPFERSDFGAYTLLSGDKISMDIEHTNVVHDIWFDDMDKKQLTHERALWIAQLHFDPSLRPIYEDWLKEQEID